MIMDPVEFEFIRQAEKANLTKEEEDKMDEWILDSEVRMVIIENILNGDMEITSIRADGEPFVRFTPQGLASASEN